MVIAPPLSSYYFSYSIVDHQIEKEPSKELVNPAIVCHEEQQVSSIVLHTSELRCGDAIVDAIVDAIADAIAEALCDGGLVPVIIPRQTVALKHDNFVIFIEVDREQEGRAFMTLPRPFEREDDDIFAPIPSTRTLPVINSKDPEYVRMTPEAEQSSIPIVFIRYNPGSFINARGKRIREPDETDHSREMAVATLARNLFEHMGTLPFAPPEKKVFRVVYVNYDGATLDDTVEVATIESVPDTGALKLGIIYQWLPMVAHQWL